jgi:hypothetical protein
MTRDPLGQNVITSYHTNAGERRLVERIGTQHCRTLKIAEQNAVLVVLSAQRIIGQWYTGLLPAKTSSSTPLDCQRVFDQTSFAHIYTQYLLSKIRVLHM